MSFFVSYSIAIDCNVGHSPQENLTWMCATFGGTAYPSDVLCRPHTCNSAYTTEAESHGGEYQLDKFNVLLTTGNAIPSNDFLSTYRDATCDDDFNASEYVTWVCPNDDGVAYPSEFFCHGK